MQDYLTNFEINWKNANILLNTTKSKTLRITRKQQKLEYPYKLNNKILENVDCKRDLKMENDTVVLAFWWGYYRKLGGCFGKTKVNLAPIETHQPPKILLLRAISTPDMEDHFSSILATF